MKKINDEKGGFQGGLEDWMTVDELCLTFNTDSRYGLTWTEAEMHLARDGKNLIFPDEKGYDTLHFLGHMFCCVSSFFWGTAFISILCFIAVTFAGNETVYSILPLFFFSLICATFIGSFFLLQSKSERFADMIPKMNNKTEVIREGTRTAIPAEEVAVGDLIMLKFGELIPADVRIIDSQNFKVDYYTLGGLRERQQLNEKGIAENPMENSSVALFSGMVIEGTAKGIVIRTGKQTLLGQIVRSPKREDLLICPIIKKIVDCLNRTCLVALVLALILFTIFLLKTHAFRMVDAFMMATTVIIGMVPKSLFPAVLIVLHIFNRKVFLRDYKLRNFKAVQRLPFVKIICLDKPGVLTANKPVVSNLWFDRKRVEVRGGTKILSRERSSATFKELALCSVLCNDAQFKGEEDHVPIAKREFTGNSEDIAILKFIAMTLGKRVEGLQEVYPKLLRGSYPKYQLSVHNIENEILIILTGEPEILLKKCSSYAVTGNREPITEEFVRMLDKACVQFSKYGDVLKCVIEQKLTVETFDLQQFKPPESGYTFLGLVTISDSPRPKIAQTIAKCREAGIKVILTTNDHPIRAKTFARTIGIITEESKTAEEKLEESGGPGGNDKVNAIVIDGMQLNKVSKRRIEKLLANYSEVVFARLSLLQKLMLLEICQQNKSIVAVVGDGIHDVLTMKKADLSITLSASTGYGNGPVADVILSEDSFYSLATCIEDSRTIYENVKKTSAFLIAGIVPPVAGVAAYTILGIPLPVNFPTIAIIQMCLELFPAAALMFEKPDPETMRRPPKELTDPIWCRQMFFHECAQIGVIESFACFFSYFIIMLEYGWSPLPLVGIADCWDSKYVSDLEDIYGQRWNYEARQRLQFNSQTAYFFTFVIVQCANVLECRNQTKHLFRAKERNWVIHFSILFKISLTFLIIYVPYLNALFNLEPLKPVCWFLPIPYFCLIILYCETKKYIIKKHPKGWLARETLF